MADAKVKKKETLLILETTEPKKIENGWEVVAIATGLYNRKYPLRPSHEIVFAVDGEQLDRVETDEESGRASTTILLPEAKSYLISAFIADLPGVRKSVRIPVKSEKPKEKRPAKLEISKSGGEGCYDLLFSVFSEDNSPLIDVVIRVFDPCDEKRFFDLPKTDKNGITQYKISFREERRTLLAVVLGSEIKKEVHLYGQRNVPRGNLILHLI